MLWFDLPPAGHAIAWRGKDHPLPQFPGYRSLWVNSGTAALAAAMWLARQRQPSIAQPEVILPAYGCPDLVSAAVHAGVRPVLVDIGSEDPGYDLDALAAALSARTVAVVAVNFLGIAERLLQLRECIAAFPQIALIEDDAQWFPEPLPVPPLEGDYVCISFGRGKPVSLLGGGLLLVKDSLPADLPIQPAADAGAALLPKLLAYNALLRPAAYGLISRNPFLKLGQTVYKPLLAIRALDARRLTLLPANVEQYMARSREIEGALRDVLAVNPALRDLAANHRERCGRLLRYPVLCADVAQCERLLLDLRRRGLGATAMYQRPLVEIDGVARLVSVSGDYPGAVRFAGRLITLPLHSGVGVRELREIRRVLRAG